MNRNIEFYDGFAGEYSEYYHRLDPRNAVEVYAREIRALGCWPATDEARVLDLGCGPGTHLAHWAAQGLNVDGLDNSPNMLRLARRKIEHASLPEIVLFCADVRDGSSVEKLWHRYALVSAHFNFLNLFSVDELAKIVGNVARTLRPHGVFAADLTCWSSALEEQAAGSHDQPRHADRACELVGTRVVPDERRITRAWRVGERALLETFHAHRLEDVVRIYTQAGFDEVCVRAFAGNFRSSGEVGGPRLDQRLLIAAVN